MEIEAVNGKANAGLTLGIIGTALSLLSGGVGLFNVHGGTAAASTGSGYVTKDELKYVQELAAKDSQIALLTSEQNTEVKIADVYERIMTRVNSDQRAQAEWNSSQSVINAQISAAVATNANSISTLQATCAALTKTVIPADNVCPLPMARFNSWTEPTATAAASGTGN